jgi:hypothetical protein
MDPNDPTQYAVAVARSVVTTGVIVATITPSWLGTNERGESILETPEVPATAEESTVVPAPAAVASNSSRLDELVGWLSSFVPEFLSQRASDHPIATAVAEGPVVVSTSEANGTESLAAPLAVAGDPQVSPGGSEITLASSDKAWLLVISAMSVAAVAYARRRWSGTRKTGVKRNPARSVPGRASGSSLVTMFKAIPRPTFTRQRGGSQPASSVTVRSNTAMRE